MPFGDKTGPLGQGPMTGRRLGYCTGNATPGRFSGAQGMGMGMRRGGGRGWGNRFRAQGIVPGAASAVVATGGAQQEVAELKTALNGLLTTLNQIQKRLDGMEAAQKAD